MVEITRPMLRRMRQHTIYLVAEAAFEEIWYEYLEQMLSRGRATMRVVLEFFKFLLILLYDYIVRCDKFLKYICSGKHEFERIIDSSTLDICEKTFQIDRWLDNTHHDSIKFFMRANFTYDRRKPHDIKSGLAHRKINFILSRYYDEEHFKKGPKVPRAIRGRGPQAHAKPAPQPVDYSIETLYSDLTNQLLDVILETKSISLSRKRKEYFRDILSRIIMFRLSLLLAERLAATNYNPSSDKHTEKLINLWNNFVRVYQTSGVDGSFPKDLEYKIDSSSIMISGRWSHIGFQGEDPGTDFRGMGILGLIQLEYLSKKKDDITINLLKGSLDEKHGYPLAIVGINMTFNLLNLFRDGSMKHFYYDTKLASSGGSFEVFHDIYVELFIRFDSFWRECKPKNIFEFRDIMERFISIIKMDLNDRNFWLKFTPGEDKFCCDQPTVPLKTNCE